MRKYFIYSIIFFSFFLISHQAHAGTLGKQPNNLNLVSYWTFDEGSGTIAADTSGYLNHGALQNMDDSNWKPGKRGKALDFNGSDEYITVPNTDLHDFGFGDFTWSAWAKADSFDDDYEEILSVHDGTQDAWIMAVQTQTSTTAKLAIYGNSNNVDVGNTTIRAGEWVHYTVTRVSGDVTLYVNGVIDNTPVGRGGTYNTNSQGVHIGREPAVTGQGRFWNGLIDEVRIYNRGLSAAEIAATYRIGTGKIKGIGTQDTVIDKGLVGYWPFNDGSGSTATDISGNNNNGSFVNSPTWATGQRGGAIQVNDSNYVAITASGASPIGFSDNEPFSVSFWMNSTDVTDGHVLGQRDGCNGNFNPWQFYLNSSSILTMGPPSGSIGVVDTKPMQTGIWYYVTATYDGSRIRLYREGELVDTSTSGLLGPLQGELRIGLAGNCGGWAGRVDDLKLYNRALSAREVFALYKGGLTIINPSQNNKITNGLVGMWSFNGPDLNSTTAFDRGSGADNGTLTSGPVIAIGKVGQALNFDGVDDYISLGTDTYSNSQVGSGSIGFWFNLRALPATDTTMNVFDIEGYLGHQIVNSSGTTRVQTRVYDGSVQTAVGTTNLVPNQWYHYFETWNGSTARVYLNGVQENSTSAGNIAPENFSRTATIGENCDICGGDGNFNGKLDEVRLYGRALTASEIKQLYNMGR